MKKSIKFAKKKYMYYVITKESKTIYCDTVKEVAEVVGVKAGTLRHHFSVKNKTELVKNGYLIEVKN